MQANETRLSSLLEGQKQYIIPLFQRAYSWDTKDWQILWDDLKGMLEQPSPRPHFIGSIVSMPTVAVPEGVGKFLLIDGQQRMTTVFILLTLLRDRANNPELAAEIQEVLLVNKFRGGDDHYKLMPTQVDREAYKALINNETPLLGSRIQNAYDFFNKKINQHNPDIRQLLELIGKQLSLVSIVLNADDNPHLVFESLNAKGRSLTQADLIRNYFFMRIHVREQDSIYDQYWLPMQNKLGDNLTEFIRHFLNRQGNNVRQSEIYQVLKDQVTTDNALIYLENLHYFATYYQKLLQPDYEPNEQIKSYLKRLNRIEVTTAYPLLLNLYSDYEQRVISATEFAHILQLLENYLIRRFVCNYPTNQLNRIFPVIYKAMRQHSDNLVDGLKKALQTRSYPRDTEFLLRIKDAKLYGGGERREKTKLFLESLEKQYQHREQVPFKNLSIEHIMPQTLTEWWQQHLGNDWQETHSLLLHTIGNLTLTGYNSELSNSSFSIKQTHLANSHLEMNAYFADKRQWTANEIEERSNYLANKALTIWPYFGDDSQPEPTQITGSTPTHLTILGQTFQVRSWRDVFIHTLNTISFLEPDRFNQIADGFPKLLTTDKSSLREHRALNNGYFVEVNLSARRIESFCRQAIQTIELGPDEWQVRFV